MPAPALTVLAHALPESIGAVPLTVVIAGVIGLFLSVNALGTRRAAALVGEPMVGEGGSASARDPAPVDRSRPSAGQLMGLAGLVVVAVLASTGPAAASENLADTLVLVLLWGAVALTSTVAGGWWWRVDPLRGANGLLAAAVGDPEQTTARPLPERTATVAAVVGLLLWAGAQLLLTPSVLAFQLLLLGYVVVHLAGSVRFGSAWLARAESLNVVSRTLGVLRLADGGPVRRLSAVPATVRQRWVAAALIGWSLTDLVLETGWWHDLGLSTGSAQLVGALLLLGTVTLCGLLIGAVGGRVGVAPAFVAVAAAWVFAHYLSLLVIDGQGLPIWLSDPFGTGADLLGRRDARVDAELIPTTVLAIIQTVPFVLGHLAAVVVVQRRAVAAVPSPAHLGPVTFLPRALIAVLLVGGLYLQLGGL